MRDMLKEKTVWFYVEILAAVLIAVAVILGWTTKGLVKNTFAPSIIICAVIGILLEILYQFINLEILPLGVTVMYALTLGIIANQGSYVISDHVNGVSFLGGNYQMVMQCLILTGTGLMLSIIALFFEQKKS